MFLTRTATTESKAQSKQISQRVMSKLLSTLCGNWYFFYYFAKWVSNLDKLNQTSIAYCSVISFVEN